MQRSALWCSPESSGSAYRRSVKRLAQRRVAVELAGFVGGGNGQQLIGPHGERRARRRTDDQQRRDRIAALSHGNESQLPSGHQPVRFERKLVEATHDDAMARVEFR